ncbi:pyridoxamine kinase [Actinotalea ferrariae CF5-4]|uniref:pyridoxal kinase n=1 Tax=Actinotalea ferrariae CF5-4 TaxID=948458 RepID=A0A021VU63_9CELL|nr:pyridoxal kinase PdxY [Actinotalea ferrariae]EYR63585.1 pyridoxamine kinase [Actinotalea ferrariae CF5-4]
MTPTGADRLLTVLSIQSHVAYGHVGNAAAVFAMQRTGVEVWPIHTVQFSNHTGYGAWKGRVFDGPAVDEVVDGIADRGVLHRCDGVLSGYLGSADVGHAVLAAVARVRAANPDAVYCADPVIGDVERGVFVRPGIPELFRDVVVPAADVLTPNHFELDHLTGTVSRTLPEVRDAVAALQARGPRAVLVTSLDTDDTPAGAVDLLAAEGDRAYRVRTPRLGLSVNGAGDAIAALFLVHWLRSRSVEVAVRHATSAVHAVLAATERAGSREITLVAAQDQLVRPDVLFDVEEV